MRADWDRRARENAEGAIYTRESAADVQDFAHSGKANYDQLVRPYIPILFHGRAARDCRVVEIGCGVGRMTEWFAGEFAAVDAIDVSPAMIDGARRRLTATNVAFHVGSGSDLAPVATNSADLVFSYIVFQHIPSREVIEGYVRDAARVLKDGGAFKFQVNGDLSPSYARHERDTWLGEVFSEADVLGMLKRAGFSLASSEGAGTQYYVITAFKGEPPEKRTYVLPGEPWAAPLLLEGFGEAVDSSWRPMLARARVRIEGEGTRLYMGLYFWPESCNHRVTMAGHPFDIAAPGDHYLECAAQGGEVEIIIEPAPGKPPAFRVIGFY